MTAGSTLLALGRFVPPRVVTNDDLAARMTTSDEWIVERSGVRERRWVEPGVGPADLAAEAARAACARAGRDPAEIDLIVFATLSPEMYFPGSGVLLQTKLGLGPIPSLDVRNQCTGFLYGLAAADGLLRAGPYRLALVVGAEVQSPFLEMADRSRHVSVLFGDGAGAALLAPSETPGILSCVLHADGAHASRLCVEAPGSLAPSAGMPAALEDGRAFPKMDGRFVFKHAVERLGEVAGEALDRAGRRLDEIDLFCLHQANLRINESVAARLGIPAGKVWNNIDRYGNTSAASIPICLSEAIEAGAAPAGGLALLAAFGSGFTWGAAVVRLP